MITITPDMARLLRAYFLARGLRGDLLVAFWYEVSR